MLAALASTPSNPLHLTKALAGFIQTQRQARHPLALFQTTIYCLGKLVLTAREMSGRRTNGAENSFLVMTAPDGAGDTAAKLCPESGCCVGLPLCWSCRSRAPPGSLCQRLRPPKLQTWGKQGVVGSAPLCIGARSWCPPEPVALCMGIWDKRVPPQRGQDGLPT